LDILLSLSLFEISERLFYACRQKFDKLRGVRGMAAAKTGTTNETGY